MTCQPVCRRLVDGSERTGLPAPVDGEACHLGRCAPGLQCIGGVCVGAECEANTSGDPAPCTGAQFYGAYISFGVMMIQLRKRAATRTNA